MGWELYTVWVMSIRGIAVVVPGWSHYYRDMEGFLTGDGWGLYPPLSGTKPSRWLHSWSIAVRRHCHK